MRDAMEIDEQVLLAPYTTFHIGGPARYFSTVKTVEELKQAIDFAKERELKIFILGGGSNILVDDAGFDGLVIKIELSGIEIQKEDEQATLIAGAGERWDALVARTVKENLWGVENLSGIPGTVGGACVQNIGAYGQVLSQMLLWAEALDTESGEIKKMSNADCRFGYRESIFNSAKTLRFGEMNGSPTPPRSIFAPWVILRAAFVLSNTPAPELSYKDLQKRFEGNSPTLSQIRAAVLEIRKGKFPDLSVEGTAGSFFKNPVVSQEEAVKLRERYPALPLFDLPEASGVKVPLAWFLDARNGVLDIQTMKIGGTRLYEKQPLVIVAQKNSSSIDVQKLAGEVQKQIQEKIGLDIEPEVRIL